MFSILIILLLFVDPLAGIQAINYNESSCYDNLTYPLNSSYEINLNNLLSNLVSQISTTKNGFLTHKQASQNEQAPVYGLALCRGDMKSQDCHDCVEMASKQIRSYCPRTIQAIIWKERCIIRYSNKSFFSLLQTQPNRTMYNNNYVTDNVDNWIKLLNDTLSEVVSKAASNQSQNLYATKEAFFAPLNKSMYSMAQCIPDFTAENCTNCLDVAVSLLDTRVLAQGGIALTPSCTLRHELYPFYQILSVSPSLPPPPPISAATIRGMFYIQSFR
ncbi:Cysteine-rich receptor-like protein kinase 25 [Bienertia sinuspersici]